MQSGISQNTWEAKNKFWNLNECRLSVICVSNILYLLLRLKFVSIIDCLLVSLCLPLSVGHGLHEMWVKLVAVT